MRDLGYWEAGYRCSKWVKIVLAVTQSCCVGAVDEAQGCVRLLVVFVLRKSSAGNVGSFRCGGAAQSPDISNWAGEFYG